MPRRARKRVQPRFGERTLLLFLLAGATLSLWCYRRTSLPQDSPRSVWEIDARSDIQFIERSPNGILQSLNKTGGPDIATWLDVPSSDDSEVFSSEWAETRLLSELPDTEPLARELGRLGVALRRHHHVKLAMQYVYTLHAPPPPLPPRFEYYSTLPLLPLVGEVFHAAPRTPCMSFLWTPIPVDGVKYIVEVAKSRSFRFFRSFGAYTNHIQLRASKKSDYFWRVRSIHRGQASLGSVSRFSVVVPEIPPEEAKRRRLASRVMEPEAWLADIQICP